MKNKIVEHLLSVLLALCLIGCGAAVPPDGVVYQMQWLGTLHFAEEALRGAPGSVVLAKDALVMTGKSFEGGWVLSMWDVSKAAPVSDFLSNGGGNGTVVNPTDASSIVEWAKQNGWEQVGTLAGSTLEVAIQSAYDTFSSLSPSFLVLPAGVDPNSFISEYLEGYEVQLQ